jgi:glutathione synthase/RimK-type ligase-like ATP-grasp enzyme
MTPSTVIILAPHEDLHALSVHQQVVASCDRACRLIDTAEYPSTVMIDTTGRGESVLTVSDTAGDFSFRNKDIASVWRRRPRKQDLPSELIDSADRDVALRDTASAMNGYLCCLSQRGCRIVNDPLVGDASLNKSYQLVCATEVGLRTPETLISNRPDSVRSFVSRLRSSKRRVIFKGFNSPKRTVVATQQFEEADLGRLPALRFAPAIFQEYVCGRNLRVTMVGNEIFAAEVLVSIPEAETDWRLECYNEVLPFELPPVLRRTLRRLMKKLRLDYGAIDLKLTRDNEFVFLEANPWGQFLFVEIQTGQPISLSLAKLLSGSNCSASRDSACRV